MEGVAGKEGHGGFRKGKGKSRGVGGREIGKDAAMWQRHISDSWKFSQLLLHSIIVFGSRVDRNSKD